MKDYDEQEAVDFIRQQLPANSREEYDDDEILNVIDIIWDFYEENGYLSLDMDDDGPDELDDEELIAYVKKVIAKDQDSPLHVSDVEKIVRAELDYEDSIG